MASGILEGLQGKLGHAAWRWLFFIEGALTIFFAAVAIFVLPDFPTTTRWLTPQERALAIKRMEEDVGISDQEEAGGQGHGFWLAITDWKVWWLAILLTSETVALSFNAYFPTLTTTLGYNPTVSLVLVANEYSLPNSHHLRTFSFYPLHSPYRRLQTRTYLSSSAQMRRR